jgi:sugar transferase (PEP-CTERM/EpsH1 system associated)
MRRQIEEPPLIVHVVHRLATGGLENVVVSLINGLPWGAYRHAVIALTEICDLRDRVSRSDVEFIALAKGPGHALRLYPMLRTIFQKLSPAIVHTCNLSALETVVPAWLARVPVRIHAEHGWDVFDPDGSSIKYRIIRSLYRPFVSHYVAVSTQLARYLTNHVGIPETRVSLIFNGVDTQRFTPAVLTREELPGFPFSRDMWVVGTVGRMQQIKNQTLLAEAFVRALMREPTAERTLRLIMVGQGPLREASMRILDAAGVRHLTWLPGERADIAQLMRRLNCFALPSLAEGTSCTIQEAMATGLPVIATAVGGNDGLVLDGVTGTLVPSADVDAMASAILDYWRCPPQAVRHGTAGLHRICENFGLQSMLREYHRLFSSLLAQKRSQFLARTA